MRYALLLLALLVLVPFSDVFAEPSFTLDKSSYVYGDTVRVSGSVQYEPGMFVLIQLRSTSDILAIDQLFPSQSGSFSASFEAEGPKWQQTGTYTIMVSYMGQTGEKSFQFTKPPEHDEGVQTPSQSAPQPPHAPAQPQAQPQVPTQESPQQTPPRITIRGFPDPSLPPQHYYDRYNNETVFREWFDSVFPGYMIQEIVGYKQTRVGGWPDPQYSPQHYIERYNNEAEFKEWFDMVFPDSTIHEILGMSEESTVLVPSWVRQYARWWSTGAIDDAQFAVRIGDLIRQNVITIEGDITIAPNQSKSIPGWFKNNATWYADGHITDEDFLRGIQYLIEREIIII